MANVLVFIEQRDGKIRKASLEALTLGRNLAKKSGGSVAAVVAGSGIAGLAGELSAYGAAKVFVADHADLALYSCEGYVAALDAAAKAFSPNVVLVSATTMGKDVAPRFAARKKAGMLSDVMALDIEGGNLVGNRSVYSGKARATVAPAAGAALQIATPRPNVFPASKDAPGAGEIVNLDLAGLKIRAKVVKLETSEAGELDVAEADKIVTGGRGIKGPESWPILRGLCKELGAALGASRAAVDAGWIDHSHQVGQTGKVVSPSLYVACGVSGAIQHLAGMGSSKVIVAINKDPEAPIFKVATYGVVGDLFQIVPAMTEAAKKMKG
ncbi:MAG: electron transfer flavoprotein subunit alpha/FixB family protein [Acidobacteria bacterium]|nr:electron transfer flavoprotein subunit alpha/FixB family protein [Acidobacteriota bacterium]MCK6683826.1 electron transfer flavoprotein subunit alpha/FixB family protein [Thermoanaerobaculia bacterium]